MPGAAPKMVCKCPHHKAMPVFIILFGLTFLLGAWNVLSWNTVGIVWPIIVILAGIMKWMEKSKMCKCC